jgi:hypothetical protein
MPKKNTHFYNGPCYTGAEMNIRHNDEGKPMKTNTLALITFTALCAHHNSHAMLCISKLRSLAPIYTQTRHYYRQIGDAVDLANLANAEAKAQQNKLASERRGLLQSRLDELHANLKKENQTIEKMNPYLDSQWNSYSDYNFITGTSLLVHSKNRKQDLEKEIFNVKMLLLKD